ncbi:MAG: asparagine synthase (glutamine-hydrolyzing) [Opitutales bacterium]|nr:asparagine synthase (glutamine-hydrolyzing) [Opitutales bacterium]
MCGIVASVGNCNEARFEAALDVITHRGPDDWGVKYFPDDLLAMGMKRLAILDINHGHQPMSDSEGRVWVVFNGEIFNAPELRERLERKGYPFQTENSDTEVLLYLYLDMGIEMLSELNGMFAFCLYDKKQRQLVGARDQIGIKPLYYSQKADSLLIASEIKSILAVSEQDYAICEQALVDYFTFHATQRNLSIYEGIHKLKPGEFFRYDLVRKTFEVEQFWSAFSELADYRGNGNLESDLWEQFQKAISRWLISDVPVGFSLSGGLDSAASVAAASSVGHRNIHTFTLGFRDIDHGELDERRLAKEVAERFGTNHTEMEIDSSDLLDELPKMVWHLDEPYAGGLPSWWVFREMSQYVKVAITGSGGDELFGNYGYGHFLEKDQWLTSLNNRRKLIPQSLLSWLQERKILESTLGREGPISSRVRNLLYPVAQRHPAVSDHFNYARRMEDLFADDSHRKLESPEVFIQKLLDASPDGDLRNSIAMLSFETQLPEEFLFMTDRFSMAHSVEARVPFLDREFVEFALRIPGKIRTGEHAQKALLRSVVRDKIPDSILNAKKRGFVLPYKKWLTEDLKPILNRLCSPERLKEQGIFREDFLQRHEPLVKSSQAGAEVRLWSMFMFQLWFQIHVVNRGTVPDRLSDLA